MTGERDTPDTDTHRSTHPRSDSRISRARSDSHSRRLRSDGGANSAQTRHRILRELRGELRRHPAVRSVEGKPPAEYREVRAVLDPSWFGRAPATASLRVTWLPNPTPGPETSDRENDTWMHSPIRAYYTLHYSEPSGFDCGFHCEPNPHTTGLLHYQQRENANEAYTYEPVSFDARSVTGLLWEMMDALADRLDEFDDANCPR